MMMAENAKRARRRRIRRSIKDVTVVGTRTPKIRVPRGGSKKKHLVTMISVLNLMSEKQRRECLLFLRGGQQTVDLGTLKKKFGRNFIIIPRKRFGGATRQALERASVSLTAVIGGRRKRKVKRKRVEKE